MAQFIGSNIETGNYGEDIFSKKLVAAYPDEYIIYRNRQVFGREFDVLMLMPEIGLVVFEVKGWRESTVLRIENGDTVILGTSRGEVPASPQKQARGYRFAIEGQLRKEFGKIPLVFSMVVYPQISIGFYSEKSLNVISEPQFTILKEDLATADALNAKIASAYNLVKGWKRAAFDAEFLYNVRCMFEGDLDSYLHPDEREKPQKYAQPPYSKFYFIPSGKQLDECLLSDITENYGKGVKLYIVVGTKPQLDVIASAVDDVLNQKSLERKGSNLEFQYTGNGGTGSAGSYSSKFSAFNCDISILTEDILLEPFCVINGDTARHRGDMVQLATHSQFSFEQYEVEHASLDKNVLVRAGAGTGKTTTMISRIAFLAHQRAGAFHELLTSITMITFTNEAADNMQRKLKRQFLNSYLLTRDSKWLLLIERIDQMQISTIHSYAKKLLEYMGTEYGYGADIKITSSEYNRRNYISQIVEEYVNQAVRTKSDYIASLGLPMYKVIDIIAQFISKLQNHSIDVDELKPENFGQLASGSYSDELHALLSHVIPVVEQKYQAELLENNTVHLGTIMSALYDALMNPASQKRLSSLQRGTSYLFVDEFQDTDNVQIEILMKLSALFRAKLFVVGDIKQCIYRFRGATELAFDQLPIHEHSQDWEFYRLTSNYRTDAQLLELFDESFTLWGEKSYLVYKPSEDKLRGIKKLNKTGDPRDYYRCIHVSSDQMQMEALFQEIARIKEKVDNDIRSGINLSDEEKTIAILVRENWQAEEIKRAGQARTPACEISTNTGGDLYQTQAAIDLLHLLNALLHYDEPEYLYSLLTSNFFNNRTPLVNLYNIRAEIESTGWMLGSDSKSKMIQELRNCLDRGLSPMPGDLRGWDFIVSALRVQPVLQLIHLIYESLHPERNYSSDLLEQREYQMNVDLIFEQVIASVNTDSLTIHSFANSLELCIKTGVSVNSRHLGDDNSVMIQCLTVHKAKGLEYGYVILPYTNARINKIKHNNLNVSISQDGDTLQIGYSLELPDSQQIYENCYFNESEEIAERVREETRILYVAMTRAIRSFSWIAKEGSKQMSWQKLIQEVGGDVHAV